MFLDEFFFFSNLDESVPCHPIDPTLLDALEEDLQKT